jgi:hypothetical protein
MFFVFGAVIVGGSIFVPVLKLSQTVDLCQHSSSLKPFAFERPGEEAVHPLLDVLAQLADRGLGDTGHAHRLHQLVDPPGGDAADVIGSSSVAGEASQLHPSR